MVEETTTALAVVHREHIVGREDYDRVLEPLDEARRDAAQELLTLRAELLEILTDDERVAVFGGD